MRPSRIKTFILGITASVAYCFIIMFMAGYIHKNVSIAYIFMMPLVLGAIPALLSTKEQLSAYKSLLLLPCISVITFFFIAFLCGFEGMICLTVIIGPFLLLGFTGAFIIRLLRLKSNGRGTKLYVSLLLPLLMLAVESCIIPADELHTVSTKIEINAANKTVWENIKNVRDIQPSEIRTHFIHVIGVPKPLDGRLDREGTAGTRSIVWGKGIKFVEKIKTWDEGVGFTYDIHVDPRSIPPTTLDEHVMIGGKYFDVVAGSYHIEKITDTKQQVTLSCTYRISTNLNFYSKLWANFILNDFNEMILEVIRGRSETGLLVHPN